ncbi:MULTISPECIES: hypothetical protein [unclassified Streptomyces]|uniref:hypothetical protein n=1 Tax=unclassified Streptomyces TaxID=2593676 RepID=UPI002366493C|nr:MULTISPECIES: hypothetical protein [unclassified Streptomyces]MDF3149037.1 hypothetical protein [Streptomyces sp. T21Q-yed]WDF38373.1 hypothetical protein PBV52_16995 [Streptomyces sp. T12]
MADGERDIRLVVLDMAGTTVADGGLVEQAFAAAARHLGADPDSMLEYVRATMGESKISVFRHLFGEEPKAQEAIEALTAQGRTVVLTTGFARPTQDAILTALGWHDLVPLTLCPADAGGRGRPYPDMVLTAFLRTAAAATQVLDSVAELPGMLAAPVADPRRSLRGLQR